MAVPAFNRRGNLPPGFHPADWTELQERFGGTEKREALLAGLRLALNSFRAAGCRTVYLDGSFVTSKLVPGDFDACWDSVNVDMTRLDPVLLDFNDRRAAQKVKYGGEFFPADWDADGLGTRFLDFFQIDKETGQRKGIVVIQLEPLS